MANASLCRLLTIGKRASVYVRLLHADFDMSWLADQAIRGGRGAREGSTSRVETGDAARSQFLMTQFIVLPLTLNDLQPTHSLHASVTESCASLCALSYYAVAFSGT